MGKISDIFNFDNIGGKIKNLAKWSCWITILLIWIAAPIAFISLIANEETAYLCLFPFIAAVVCPVCVWIGSWTLYAFGEFVEDTHAMRNKENPPATEKAKRQVEEKAKRQAEEKAKRQAEEKALNSYLPDMDKPSNFTVNVQWESEIRNLSADEIRARYFKVDEWTDGYRYQCYLELKKRGARSSGIDSKEKHNPDLAFKINRTGTGYICPVCGVSNDSFSPCAQCGGFDPLVDITANKTALEDNYVDIICPTCKEPLSFLENETDAVCPWCSSKIDLK